MSVHSDTARAILDSFDVMDPTRSHELRPSRRIRNGWHERRLVEVFGWLLIGAVLLGLALLAVGPL